MVAEIRADQESEWAAMTRVSELLGVGTPETVRRCVRPAEIDGGTRPGATSEESEQVRRLKRENAELRRANRILKAAALNSTRLSSGPSSTGRPIDRGVHPRPRRPTGNPVACVGVSSRSVPC